MLFHVICELKNSQLIFSYCHRGDENRGRMLEHCILSSKLLKNWLFHHIVWQGLYGGGRGGARCVLPG